MRRQNDGFDELIRRMLERQTDEQAFDVVKSIVTTAIHGEEEE